MEEINLTDFQPKSHPLKSVFKRQGVPQIVLSRFLGVSLAQLCFWLNGYRPMPEHAERSLSELVEQLEKTP
jgi:hypothetical protein